MTGVHKLLQISFDSFSRFHFSALWNPRGAEGVPIEYSSSSLWKHNWKDRGMDLSRWDAFGSLCPPSGCLCLTVAILWGPFGLPWDPLLFLSDFLKNERANVQKSFQNTVRSSFLELARGARGARRSGVSKCHPDPPSTSAGIRMTGVHKLPQTISHAWVISVPFSMIATGFSLTLHILFCPGVAPPHQNSQSVSSGLPNQVVSRILLAI